MIEVYHSDADNWRAYAVGAVTKRGRGFKVRRVVWGRLAARAECRKGEKIAKACIMVEKDGYGCDVKLCR